jgi:hypothetical protein
MPTPGDFNPENCRIHWPAILVVFAVQMIALIVLCFAVANHSTFATASSQDVKAGLNVADKSDGSKSSYKTGPRAPIKSGRILLATPN